MYGAGGVLCSYLTSRILIGKVFCGACRASCCMVAFWIEELSLFPNDNDSELDVEVL